MSVRAATARPLPPPAPIRVCAPGPALATGDASVSQPQRPAHRHVSARDVFELVGEVRRGTRALHQEASGRFETLKERTGDLLEHLRENAPRPHGPVVANPEVALNHQGRPDPFTYGTLEGGQLYVEGIDANDFTQAGLGNCAFLASMASIAASRPELIEDMIQDNRDGTYTVRFFNPDGTEAHITVDDQLPLTRGGVRGYTKARDPQELWLSIVEKAYAVYRGGSYERIESQSPAVVMQHLTGGKKSVYGVKPGDDRIYGQLERALAEGRFIVAGNFVITDDPNTPKTEHNDPAFVVPHAYTVLEVLERDGERFVVLRNPWGKKEYGTDGKDDGTFELPLQVFTEQFAYADVVG